MAMFPLTHVAEMEYNYPQVHYEEEEDMTICIATLCENNGKLVAVSDRMTTAEFLSLEFEHAKIKMDELSHCTLALTSGDALAHTDLLRDVIGELAHLTIPSIRHVAQKVEKAFISARQDLAEKMTLQAAGMCYQEFIQQQRNLNPDMVLGLAHAYSEVKLGLEIVVAGVDASGAHIYGIEDPGVVTCYDALGFAAIGSGLPHAMSFLTEVNYRASLSLNEALWITYEAKRRSERAPGVGSKFTDVVIIDDSGIEHLGETTIKQLENVHESYRDSLGKVQSEIDKMVAALHTTKEDKT